MAGRAHAITRRFPAITGSLEVALLKAPKNSNLPYLTSPLSVRFVGVNGLDYCDSTMSAGVLRRDDVEPDGCKFP